MRFGDLLAAVECKHFIKILSKQVTVPDVLGQQSHSHPDRPRVVPYIVAVRVCTTPPGISPSLGYRLEKQLPKQLTLSGTGRRPLISSHSDSRGLCWCVRL